MRQKLYTMFFCVFSLAFVATDCKHNPVGPEIIQPGRRDYTWTFDTLHLQQGYLQSIWGSSPTDIWACGYDRFVPLRRYKMDEMERLYRLVQ